MIRHAEKYHVGGCKKEKEELADLVKEEEKKDILRRLSLYSSKVSDYKWVCSKCFEDIYLSNRHKKE
jgi:hypothetical protein